MNPWHTNQNCTFLKLDLNNKTIDIWSYFKKEVFYLPEECAFLTLASTTMLVVLHLNTFILYAILFF